MKKAYTFICKKCGIKFTVGQIDVDEERGMKVSQCPVCRKKCYTMTTQMQDLADVTSSPRDQKQLQSVEYFK